MPDLHFPFGRRVVLGNKKKREKSIHYSNTSLIHSYDQQLYYVSSVIPPYANSICSFHIVRTEGRGIKLPLCSLVSKSLRQSIHIVWCEIHRYKVLCLRTKYDWRILFQNLTLSTQNNTLTTQKYSYSKINWIHNFSSLLNITLNVSDGLSVRQQKFKTLHTASSMSYRFADCVLTRSQRTCMT
jgi:hypothetical protein